MSGIQRFTFVVTLAIAISAFPQQPVSRAVGSVSSIQGSTIALKADNGGDMTVTVADGARLLRTAPGQTDLKTATPISVTDIQAGDRILIRGAADGNKITANLVVVMKQSDVAARQQKEREDWQRRGVGGLVKLVDPATGKIELATTGFSAEAVTVETSKSTIIRKYAEDSVKFDDAKISSLDQIKPGDQLRARGSREPGSPTVTAEEIVFGTFRNVAGTVVSTDPANQTVTVMDLATKKPVVVKITAESQMHKLQPMIAQFIAMRMKGGAQGGEAGGQQRQQGGQRGFGGGGPRNADMSQMLTRMPPVTLADLQKGDALMIVTTAGNGSAVSAVTLLAGVEPILAAPNPLSASTIMSPWNISGGGGEEGPQ